MSIEYISYDSGEGAGIDFGTAQNEKEDIFKNVQLILGTFRGTVPMDREFGISKEFLDKPDNIASSLLLADIAQVVDKYEPRAKIKTAKIQRYGRSGTYRLTVGIEVVNE